MSLKRWSTANLRIYLIAFASVVIAAAIRYQLGPVLGGTIPVVIFTVPVTLAALYGGFGPGIFATFFSALISNYLFIDPIYSIGIESLSSAVVLGTFFLIGVTISFFGQRMKSLQSRLAMQARRLETANKELEDGNLRKDEFLAMLAHELRNPLAGINTAAELLKFLHSDQKRIAQTSEVITRQVRHMTKLVDDLLDVSRVTRGLVIIEKKPVDLKEALQAAIEQIRTAFNAKGQQISLTLPDDHACVCGDRVRLTQVVSNLLANANRYSPAGSAIHIHIGLTDTAVRLCVEDNGQGIDAALLPRIFDLFVQAERTPDRSQGGLGIGLALVKKIIELHDGTVEAYSAGLHRGSRFTITLPRLAQQVKKPGDDNEEYEVPVRTRAMNILVVDDNKDAADTLAMLLESSGHTVFVEYSARGALDRSHQEELDAVVLDIGLPEIDGHELCRRMKKMPHLTNAAFIALSGYALDADQKKSRESGFDHHLVKPVSMDELAATLAGKGRALKQR